MMDVKLIIKIIDIILLIVLFIYINSVYNNTIINPFHLQLGFQEKKNFFVNLSEKDFFSQCAVYTKEIKDQNTKTLGDVFELNIRKINMCALLLIFILYYRLFSYVFLSIFALSRNFLQSKFRRLFIFFSIIYAAIIYSITYIILFEFITFISIVYNFFSGDINNFIKFLSCKNVNYDGFDRFRIVEEIKSDFIMYFILKIIHIIFDILTLLLRVSQT